MRTPFAFAFGKGSRRDSAQLPKYPMPVDWAGVPRRDIKPGS